MLLGPLTLALTAATSTATVTPNVEAYVREALHAHPDIRASQQRAIAARERITPAGAWDDPSFSVAIQNLPYDPLSLNATPMSGVKLGITQRLPWPGKRALAEDSARARAAAAEQSIEEQKLRLAAEVRTAYYDIHLLDVSKVVLETNRGILDHFIEVADTKYRVGKGLQRDVLRARVARAELDEQQLGVDRKRAALVEGLRNLLARDEALEVPPLLDVPISQPRADLAESGLLGRAEQTRPQLRALRHTIEGAVAGVALADKAALPDVGVSLSYTLRGDAGGKDPAKGADFLGLGVTVPLPVFYGSKQEPAAQAARATERAAREALRAARLQIRGEIARALTELPRLEAQMRMFSDEIIPTTQQTLDADLVAYQVDKVSFLDLLEVQMKLVRYQIDFHRLHVMHEQLIIRLARALGGEPADLAHPGAAAHLHGAH